MADDTTDTQATTPDAASQQADTTTPAGSFEPLAGTPAGGAPADASETSPQEAAAASFGDSAPAEEAPSGGDGSQGTGLPTAPEADPTPAASEGLQEASATAEAPAEGDALTPATSTAPEAAPATDGELAATGTDGGIGSEQAEATPEAPAADPAQDSALSTPSPTDASDKSETSESTAGTDGASPAGAPDSGAEEGSETPAPVEAPLAPSPIAPEEAPTIDAPAQDKPAEDKPAEQPTPVAVVMTSPMLSDNSIPQHGTNDAPPVAAFEGNTLFGGQAGPSPAPDVPADQILPHPAWSDQSPGFISGTTQGTQSALPTPGPADQAQSTAAALSGTGNQSAGGLDGATVNTGAHGVDGDSASQGTDSKDSDSKDDDSKGTEATSALPVAASVQETFKTLSEDGKAIAEALSKVSDDIGDVIALEFKSLANVAAHISGRLEEVKHKLDEPEQRSQLVTVANQVLELLGSLSGLFGEEQSDAPLPPDVETMIGNLGDLGESARDALYA